MSDLLITGGTVIDGTGAAGRLLDVRVREGRIVEVAAGLSSQGETVIDATGATVTPGFIDSHTHFDGTIYWDPSCNPMLEHGVTSVVIGNCALGFAPMRPQDRSAQVALYSYIEDMPDGLLEETIPWGWETFGEYSAHLSRHPLGINVAGFAGHSQLRIYVMGEAAWERAATAAEIAAIASELDAALAAGALGMSFSLFDKDRQGRWVPSVQADDAELDALFAVLGRHGGTFQFVASGDRTDTMIEQLEWLGGFMRRHAVTGFYNAVVQMDGDPDRTNRVIECIAALRAAGTPLHGMVSPREFELSIGFEQTICLASVPAWNELVQASPEDKRRLLADAEWRARARGDSDTHPCAMFPFDRPALLRIASGAGPAAADWIGRTLGDLTLARGGHISDVLADWLQENDLDTSFTFAIANTDAAAVAGLLRSPGNFVSGSDAGAHLKMFCAAGDATLLLIRYVRERGDMTLESAVHALTGRQAELLGLRDRGIVAPGQAADLTIFALDELTYGLPYIVEDLPHGRSRLTRDGGGYRHTIVNGVVAQTDGRWSGALSGSWARRGAHEAAVPAE